MSGNWAAARPRTSRVSKQTESNSWCAWLAASVAAWTVLDPYLGLRYGGVVVLLAALTMRRSFKLYRTDGLLIALGALAMLSFTWAAAPEATWEALKNQASIAALVIGVRVIASNRRHVRLIAVGFLVGCDYSAYQLWTAGNGLIADGAQRLAVDGVNQNYTAYALATGAALTLLLLTATRRRVARLLLVGNLVACSYGVHLTGTRAAEYALFALGAWIVIYRISPRRMLQVLTWTGGIGLIILSAGWADKQITPSQVAGRETGTLNGRLDIWPYARELFARQPVLGYGDGAFRALNPMQIVAHNALLEIVVGLGLIGAILWCTCVYSILIRDTRDRVTARDRSLIVGGVITVTLPILATGNWDQSGAAWVVFALISRMAVLQGNGGGGDGLDQEQSHRASSEGDYLPVTTRSPHVG